MVSHSAGALAGGVFCGHPADDRRELFGAGHVREQQVLLGWP